MFLGGTDVRKWLRYTALALAAAVLVTVAAGCEVYLERRGAVTTPACELRNGYPSVAASTAARCCVSGITGRGSRT